MIHFTDGDVAAILAAIINGNRSGYHRSTMDAMESAGMPDSVYDFAYSYAVRSGFIVITGQHNGVTRKGRRYMRSTTLPASYEQDPKIPAWTVVDEDYDAGRMGVKNLSDLEAEWVVSGPDASPADLANDADTADL